MYFKTVIFTSFHFLMNCRVFWSLNPRSVLFEVAAAAARCRELFPAAGSEESPQAEEARCATASPEDPAAASLYRERLGLLALQEMNMDHRLPPQARLAESTPRWRGLRVPARGAAWTPLGCGACIPRSL